MNTARSMTPPERTHHRWPGVLGIVTALLISLPLVTGIVGLLREVLHYRCSWIEQGDASEWICADGVGYILPGAAVATGIAVSCVLAIAATGLRSATARVRSLALIALFPPAVSIAVTVQAAYGSGVQRDATQSLRIDAWNGNVLPAAVVFAFAVAAALGVMFAAGRPGPAARMLVCASLGLLLATAAAQLLISAGLVAALGIQFAALSDTPALRRPSDE